MSASALTTVREAAEAMLTDWLADEPDWADALSVERIELEDRSSLNQAGGPKNSFQNEQLDDPGSPY